MISIDNRDATLTVSTDSEKLADFSSQVCFIKVRFMILSDPSSLLDVIRKGCNLRYIR